MQVRYIRIKPPGASALADICKDLFGADFRYQNVMVYLSEYINMRK